MDLNNLAGLYRDTNRLNEAEPLSRRMLEIFINFTHTIGQQHPHLQGAMKNYASLLHIMGWSEEQIVDHLRKIAPELFNNKKE